MQSYLNIVRYVLEHGTRTENRTGVETLTVSGVMFEHDMATGFPLLTTKHVPFGLVASELEFFLHGRTDKRWLQERGNHIWDEWCTPEQVRYGYTDADRSAMKGEIDLGPIYGWQWRHFGATYQGVSHLFGWPGVDQLADVLRLLKTDPTSRRMLVSAWNPKDLGRMALPPCHFAWQVTVNDGRLNLLWSQRSVDVALGLPFNIASYALLYHLLCRHSGFKPGRLVGFLADTHIYVNHVDGLRKQLERPPLPLCRVSTPVWAGLFDWKYTDTMAIDYQHHAHIKFEIAV